MKITNYCGRTIARISRTIGDQEVLQSLLGLGETSIDLPAEPLLVELVNDDAENKGDSHIYPASERDIVLVFSDKYHRGTKIEGSHHMVKCSKIDRYAKKSAPFGDTQFADHYVGDYAPPHKPELSFIDKHYVNILVILIYAIFMICLAFTIVGIGFVKQRGATPYSIVEVRQG